MRRLAGTIMAHAVSNAPTSLHWPHRSARPVPPERPGLTLIDVAAAIEAGLGREWSVRPDDDVDLGSGRHTLSWSARCAGTSTLWMVMTDGDPEVVLGFADTATLLVDGRAFAEADACLSFLRDVAAGVASGNLVTYGRNGRDREETTVLQAGPRVVVLTSRSPGTAGPEILRRYQPWPTELNAYDQLLG